MIEMVRWEGSCNSCCKESDDLRLIYVTTPHGRTAMGMQLCPKCRRQLVKKLIANKED